MYKIIKDKLTNDAVAILKTDDMKNIPISNGNTDYQEYLEWVAKGNTPEEAD